MRVFDQLGVIRFIPLQKSGNKGRLQVKGIDPIEGEQ